MMMMIMEVATITKDVATINKEVATITKEVATITKDIVFDFVFDFVFVFVFVYRSFCICLLLSIRSTGTERVAVNNFD